MHVAETAIASLQEDPPLAAARQIGEHLPVLGIHDLGPDRELQDEILAIGARALAPGPRSAVRCTEVLPVAVVDQSVQIAHNGKDDLVLQLPVGTQVMDAENRKVLADFTRPGERRVFLKGGDGGFGNAHHKSSTNRAPRRADPGWPGREAWVWLRLKLIADVGLVGLPNAGKSTLLAAVSHARPKIADYPFTTLKPQLGVVRLHDEEIVLADLPGLIEGASDGAGIGTRFLGHVERCSVILHLVDGTLEDVAGAHRTIRQELELYGHGLAKKPEIVGLNKTDALDPGAVRVKLRELRRAGRRGTAVLPLSGATGIGVPEMLEAVLRALAAARAAKHEAGAVTRSLVYTP